MSIMKAGGKLVSLKGLPNGAFAKRMKMPMAKQLIFKGAGAQLDKMAKKYNVTYDFMFVEANGNQLQEIATLFEELKIQPSIDTIFNFEDVNEALLKVQNGNSKGKTVLTFK